MNHLIINKYSVIEGTIKISQNIFDQYLLLHPSDPNKNYAIYTSINSILPTDEVMLEENQKGIHDEYHISGYIIKKITPVKFQSESKIFEDKKILGEFVKFIDLEEDESKVIRLLAVYFHENNCKSIRKLSVKSLADISRVNLTEHYLIKVLENSPLVVSSNDEYFFISNSCVDHFVAKEISEFHFANYKGRFVKEISYRSLSLIQFQNSPEEFRQIAAEILDVRNKIDDCFSRQNYELAAAIRDKGLRIVNEEFISQWNLMNMDRP